MNALQRYERVMRMDEWKPKFINEESPQGGRGRRRQRLKRGRNY